MKFSKESRLALLAATMVLSLMASALFANESFAKGKEGALPSQFDADSNSNFSESKWRSLTESGITALDKKNYVSAEQYFQAAVREASKSPTMSTYMIDSLVHSAEVCRLTNRKEDAKEYFDQALELVKVLVADKCPLCEETKESIPIIYGPHSEELEAWAKGKAAQLGDMKDVTQKRVKRPVWYCKQCEKAY